MNGTLVATCFVIFRSLGPVTLMEINEAIKASGYSGSVTETSDQYGLHSGFVWFNRLEAKEGNEGYEEIKFVNRAHALALKVGIFSEGNVKFNVGWHYA